MPTVSAEDHLPLVVHIARRYHRPGGPPLPDLVQECCLGLLRAVRLFDAGRGVEFSTFAGPAIRWSVSRAFRKHRRGDRANLKDWQGQGLAAAPGPSPDAAEEAAALLRRLPERDRRFVEMRFGPGGGEMTTREIAESQGVSRQWVEVVLARSLERLRRYAGLSPART
jgi:RNA polymerase sigma factor (sigma-70 family)